MLLALAPETSVSTNSTTWALKDDVFFSLYRRIQRARPKKLGMPRPARIAKPDLHGASSFSVISDICLCSSAEAALPL